MSLSPLLSLLWLPPALPPRGTSTFFTSLDCALVLAAGTQTKVVVVPTAAAGHNALPEAGSSCHVVVTTDFEKNNRISTQKLSTTNGETITSNSLNANSVPGLNTSSY